MVGILSLLWNASARYDYTMTQLGDLALVRDRWGSAPRSSPGSQAFPAWAMAAWAIGVWGSVLGSILLLLRSRHAATAFLLSLVGAPISFGYQFTAETAGRRSKAALPLVMPVVIMIADRRCSGTTRGGRRRQACCADQPLPRLDDAHVDVGDGAG